MGPFLLSRSQMPSPGANAPAVLQKPRWRKSPAELGTGIGGSNRRYLLGKEVPGADDELEDVLQGLEGAHERLAGLPPARLLHVLRQHREQLPMGWGRHGQRFPGIAEQPLGWMLSHATLLATLGPAPALSPAMPTIPFPLGTHL